MNAKRLTADDVALHVLAALSPSQRSKLLVRPEEDLQAYLDKAAPVVEAVRTEGDAAVMRFAREFDGAKLDADGIAAAPEDFARARAALDPELIGTLEYAAENIRRYHEAQRPQDMWMKEVRPGVLTGERHTPVDSAALYVPRGKGSFPSVALMTAIPAIVAGVEKPIMLTPPKPDGGIDDATLVAAEIAGIRQVYKAGGAVAVAAAAFGTETIPRCVKFEGPGSPWVVAAKRLLQGRIASRVPAGPSESIVLADATTSPELAALDLLVESEHGPDSSVFLVTWDGDFAAAARAAIPGYWQEMGSGRVAFSSTVLGGKNGGIVLASSPQDAYDFVNDYAPEHLQILSRMPFEHLNSIRNASEILLGEHAAGSIANYVMGPNAVLPTAGGARFGSPLGVHDFMKSASVAYVSSTGYAEMAPHTRRFAEYEGFDAHANAVSALRTRSAS